MPRLRKCLQNQPGQRLPPPGTAATAGTGAAAAAAKGTSSSTTGTPSASATGGTAAAATTTAAAASSSTSDYEFLKDDKSLQPENKERRQNLLIRKYVDDWKKKKEDEKKEVTAGLKPEQLSKEETRKSVADAQPSKAEKILSKVDKFFDVGDEVSDYVGMGATTLLDSAELAHSLRDRKKEQSGGGTGPRVPALSVIPGFPNIPGLRRQPGITGIPKQNIVPGIPRRPGFPGLIMPGPIPSINPVSAGDKQEDPEDPKNMAYVLNAYTEQELREEAETINTLGDPCGEGDFDELTTNLFYNCLQDDNSKTETRFHINDSEFGYVMTGYLPIIDSQGNGVCVLAMDVSMDLIHENMRSYLIIVALGTLGLLVLFLFVFITIMNRSVIMPIKRIAESADNFVQQSYETDDPSQLSFREVSVHTKDEIELLANSLNHMTREIQNYMINVAAMSAEKERIGAGLNVANQIQNNMFPTVFPAFPNRTEFDIYATRTAPGGEGHFYDFFLIDKNHLCIVVGEALGKGIPAMLLAILTAANIRSFARLGYKPYRIALETNNQLSQNNTEGLTVSAFIGIINLKTGEMEYVNADQPTTIIKRAGDKFEEVNEAKSFRLANMENVNFQQNHITFMQGDTMVLYTSGVSEAKNRQGEEFSEAYITIQLNEIIKHEYQLDRILEEMKKSLNEFQEGAPETSSGVMLMFRFFG